MDKIAAKQECKNGFTTHDMIVMSICAATYGALGLFVSLLDHLASQLLGLYGGYLVAGLLNAPGITSAYLLRKPGVAFVTQNLFGFAQLAFGSPDGAYLLWYTLAEGTGQELFFFLTRYRKWNNLALGGCGIMSFAAAQVPTYLIYRLGAMPLWNWLAPIILAGVPSAAIFSIILPRTAFSVVSMAGLRPPSAEK